MAVKVKVKYHNLILSLMNTTYMTKYQHKNTSLKQKGKSVYEAISDDYFDNSNISLMNLRIYVRGIKIFCSSLQRMLRNKSRKFLWKKELSHKVLWLYGRLSFKRIQIIQKKKHSMSLNGYSQEPKIALLFT